MNSILIVPILLPVVTGLLCLLISKRRILEVLTFFGMFLTSVAALVILLGDSLRLRMEWIDFSYFRIEFDLYAYHFSSFILLACSFFGLLVTIYSLKQMKDKDHLKDYYCYLLLTVGFANGALLSNNLVILLIFWGMIAIMLYLMIRSAGIHAEKAAKKSFIIVGGSDFLMLLGVVIVWQLSGSLTMTDMTIPVRGGLPTAAFILLMIGAIAKVGAMPFLPAALDKLLGIYLLTRLTLDLFVLDNSMKILLMTIGSITIIAAVMMALIQKDLKKLLSFHAISQVGYMVLGIGTGTMVGIAGGLFHMLNNVIYKTCLFLCAGSIEHRTKTTHLENLGGLSKSMPVTFIACAIAAFSISGVPPFNGFVSKWMVYQGTIEMGGPFWPVFLITAMFGSALTLASFVKVLHSVFLGQKPKEISEPKEVEFSMKIPMIILAFLCVFFGIFAQFPLKYVIGPVLGQHFAGFGEAISFSGMWSPTLATLLLSFSLICGIIIYRFGSIKNVKDGEIFVGGESIDGEEVRISGTHFYDTIESMGFLRILFEKGKSGGFDIYERGKSVLKTLSMILYQGVDRMIERFYDGIQIVTIELSQYFRKAHTGLLTTYFIWFLVGITVLLLILMK